LLICNHGVYGGVGTAQQLADKLAGQPGFSAIDVCCLRGSPSLEDAIERLADDQAADQQIVLLPNLMADGYAMGVLRDRAFAQAAQAKVAIQIAAPLGSHRDIPAILDSVSMKACAAQGWPASETTLLIVGHGSGRSRKPAEVTRMQAKAVAHMRHYAEVKIAFLDEAPSIKDAITATIHRPVVVVGLFADLGPHGVDDIPEQLGDCGDEIVYAGPIGGTAPFIGLARKEAAAWAARTSDILSRTIRS